VAAVRVGGSIAVPGFEALNVDFQRLNIPRRVVSGGVVDAMGAWSWCALVADPFFAASPRVDWIRAILIGRRAPLSPS
jgi:hypothetical protein